MLFGFGLLVCSLPQTPAPWSQLARIRDTHADAALQAARRRCALVRGDDAPGRAGRDPRPARPPHRLRRRRRERLALLEHRVDADAEQLRRTIAVLRREGARKLYMALNFTPPSIVARVRGRQIARERSGASGMYVELVDRSAAGG